MIKVLFVCHGNICRSPMAEAVFRDYIKKKGYEDKIVVDSAATSSEEIGNGVYPGTRKILDREGISYENIYSRRLTKADAKEFNYIIGMDLANIRNIKKMTGIDDDKRVFRILDITDEKRDVSDPWYTRDFEQTYKDVTLGVKNLLEIIKKECKL